MIFVLRFHVIKPFAIQPSVGEGEGAVSLSYESSAKQMNQLKYQDLISWQMVHMKYQNFFLADNLYEMSTYFLWKRNKLF